MEHREPRCVHPHELPLLVQPPLRLEVPAVGAPHSFVPRHRVRAVVSEPPGLHARTVREHVVRHRHSRVDRDRRVHPERLRYRGVQVVHPFQLLVAHIVRRLFVVLGYLFVDSLFGSRVDGQQPEEPGQARRRCVLAGENEADHYVPQELPLLLWSLEHPSQLVVVFLERRREPRQQRQRREHASRRDLDCRVERVEEGVVFSADTGTGAEGGGSVPKAMVQMLSKAKRRSRSWRSTVLPSSEAIESRGRSRSRSWNRTTSETKDLRERVVNSRLAVLRWRDQRWPSALTMPWPRRSESAARVRPPLT
ncbi:unnamed protein product [Musa acuminata subsp. burmannicoides]